MKFRTFFPDNFLLPAMVLCLFLAASQVHAESRDLKSSPADKTFVLDGHVRHDVGTLHNHVSNFGMIGSAPSASTPYQAAPSGRWPGESGTDFLWSGGLWLGGVVSGEKRVSCGGWQSTLFPTTALEDTIYAVREGVSDGARFPRPGADDDGDGYEDEDPINGRDDDGDGLVDEDFAAISHQHFRCEMRDDTEAALGAYPDHKPLGLSIVQDSYQWDLPRLTNAIGYEFTITNVGLEPVENLHFGMFGDFDIDNYSEDLAGIWIGEVTASDGVRYPVALAFMNDGSIDNPVMGHQAWLLLGHTTDPSGVSAPVNAGVNSCQIFAGNQAYGQGGDPTNDAERFEAMSANQIDAEVFQSSDYRVLITSGPFSILLPGESLEYQVALVAGLDIEELLRNAAEMSACYQGRMFDRDGQPEQVHWIPLGSPGVSHVDDPQNSIVHNLQGPVLNAFPNPFNPRLEIKYATNSSGQVRLQIFDMRGHLVRNLIHEFQPAGEGTLFWDGLNDQGQSMASGVYQLKLEADGKLAERRVTLVR